MPDKPDPQELKALLAKIISRKVEPPEAPENQDGEPGQFIEAEKILLRDGLGKSRGKISATADGSAGLILSNAEGSAWAWLGINRDGEAFLELKDKKGEIRFKVPGEPVDATAAVASRPDAESTKANPAPSDSPVASQPDPPDERVSASPNSRKPEPALPNIPPDWKPPYVDTTVYDRLEELERKNRGRGFFRAAMLGLLVMTLGIQAFMLLKPQNPQGALQAGTLALRDHNGVLRAWLGEKDGNPFLYLRDQRRKLRAALALAADGSPSLVPYDEHERLRAGLHLGANGTPRLVLRNKSILSADTGKNSVYDNSNQQSPAVTGTGYEEGTVAGPPADMAADSSPDRDSAIETYFVGSKTSNKYHYPSCKWAKTIKPARLIKFKAVAEAQTRKYIPCPVCKPPPLPR